MQRFYVTAVLTALVIGAAAAAPTLRPTATAAPTALSDPPPQATIDPKTIPELSELTDPSPAERARVELVFVLDTTGSMGGLIEGAKETIWSVVNDFASQQPRPELRVGIVAYRDRGDAYVSQSHPLTGDLDQIYGVLRSLRADGGGDGPESVVRGLMDAVDAQPWTREGRVFRSVFLVGDAPDKHYADEPSADEVVRHARQRGIFVNAIQCGTMSETGPQFRSIATIGGGVFTVVAQDGAVERLESPYDARLDALDRELSSTVLSWGSGADKRGLAEKMDDVSAASPSIRAARRSALTKGGGKVVTSTGRGDLLDDIADGRVDLDAVTEELLPDALQALAPEARQAEIDQQLAKRKAVQAEIVTLVGQRDAWIDEERARRAADGETRYDREVVQSSLEKLRAMDYIE